MYAFTMYPDQGCHGSYKGEYNQQQYGSTLKWDRLESEVRFHITLAAKKKGGGAFVSILNVQWSHNLKHQFLNITLQCNKKILFIKW